MKILPSLGVLHPRPRFTILVGSLFGILAVLSSCRSFSVSYTEGIEPLGRQEIPLELKELLGQLDKAPAAKHKDLILAWRQWMGAKEIPIWEGSKVTFLHIDSTQNLESVGIEGQFNGYSNQDFLYRHGDTAVFYKTYLVPGNPVLRYRYSMGKNSLQDRDKENPYVDPGQVWLSLTQRDPDRGRIMRTSQVASGYSLITSRELLVYLPPEYTRFTQRRFPVLYVLDGQNAWDSFHLPNGGWKLDSTLGTMAAEGKLKSLVVVGIPAGKLRRDELMGVSAYYKAQTGSKQVEAENSRSVGREFINYIMNDIKPWVESNLRVLPGRENTGVAGTSAGAGTALHLALGHPEAFSRAAALSGGHFSPESEPQQWPTRPYRMFTWLEDKVLGPPVQPVRIYMDTGTEGVEEIYSHQVESLHRALLRVGFQNGTNVLFYHDEGGTHDESAWARRFPRALEYLFPPTKESP